MKVTIYTDGSCTLTENGKGGYGAVLIHEDGGIEEIYGGYTKTTNNRMELIGVIKSLEHLKNPSQVSIYSDSKYVVDAINKKWIVKWTAKGFKNIKNSDMWKELLKQMARHTVDYNWVKGHVGDTYNERADELATIGASMKELILDRVPHEVKWSNGKR